MINFLFYELIKKYGYVDVKNLLHRHLELLEFFDKVLISADEPKLCLFKEADDLTVEELEEIMIICRQLIQREKEGKKTKFRAVVFLNFKNGIDPGRIWQLQRLSCFSSSMLPVIADAKEKKIHYDVWKIPLLILPEVEMLRRTVEKAETLEISDRELDFLKFEEAKTIGKIDSFRKALHSTRPYMTWLLIIFNVAVWALMEIWGLSSNSELLIQYGAKVPPLIWQGEIWRLLTPAFIHAGLLHLFSNCVIIFFIGPLLETVFGRWRLLLIYLMSGIMGNMLSVRFSAELSAGASSAVFGILGALIIYGILYRKDIAENFARVILFYVIPFVLYNLIVGRFNARVDNYAHVGGLLGGMLTASMLGVEYPRNISRNIKWVLVTLVFLTFALTFSFSMIPYERAYGVYYYVLGTRAAASKEYAASISYLEESVQNYEKSIKDVKSKRSVMEDAVRTKDVLGRVYSGVAFDLFQKELYDKSLKYFTTAIENISLKESNGRVLVMDYIQMAKIYEMKMDNLKAALYLKKALVLIEKKDGEEAKNLKRSLSKQYQILAKGSFIRYNYDKSMEYVNLSLKHDPENEESLVLKGEIYYREGSFTKAARLWLEASKSGSGSVLADRMLKINVFRNLWYPLSESAGVEEANKKAQEEIDRGEKLIRDVGDYNAAIEAWKKAAELDPGTSTPYNRIAKCYLFLGDSREADKYVIKAIKMEPGNPESILIVASLLFLKGQKTKALLTVEELVRRQPKFAEAWALKGMILNEEQKAEEAVAALRKALEIYPEQALWRLEIALALSRQGKDAFEYQKELITGITYAENQGRLKLEILMRSLLNSKIMKNYRRYLTVETSTPVVRSE